MEMKSVRSSDLKNKQCQIICRENLTFVSPTVDVLMRYINFLEGKKVSTANVLAGDESEA
jgi:hypothetical protein